MLLSLPLELLDQILLYLPLPSLLALTSTCHSLQSLLGSGQCSPLWTAQLVRHHLSLPGDQPDGATLAQFRHRYLVVRRCEKYLEELSFTHLAFDLVEIDPEGAFLRETLSDPLATRLTLAHLTRLPPSGTEWKNNDELTELTRLYYGRHLLVALTQAQILAELGRCEDVFEGAMALSRWIGACCFEPPGQDCYPVREGMAAMAERVRARLADQPGTAVEDVLAAISAVLFTDYGFSGNTEDYYNLDNNRLDRVFLRRKGIPITLSLIYHELARRLGLTLQLTNFPRHFLLGFRSSTSETLYIDPFHGGAIYSRARCLRLCPMAPIEDKDSYFREASPRDVLARLLRNSITYSSGMQNLFFTYNLYKLLHTVQGDEPSRNYLYQLSMDTGVRCGVLGEHVPPVVEQAIEKEAEAHCRRFRCKESKPAAVTFDIGQVVRHKRYNYTCVVYGWDERCLSGPAWEIRMGVAALEHQGNQPFYYVLADDDSSDEVKRYVAQENLVPCRALVKHNHLGKYFKLFDGERFVPNSALRSVYRYLPD